MNKVIDRKRRPLPCLAGLFCLVLAGLLSVAEAREDARTRPPLPPMRTDVFTVYDKSPDYNFIFIKDRRMRVSATARILNAINSPITLEELPIPCKARITYRMFGARDPMVEKIVLVK